MAYSTPGDFFSFITAAMLSYDPLKRLSSLNAGLQEGLAAAERVFGILNSKPVVVDSPGARPLKIAGGALTLSDVTFTYDGETKALERFDLSIPPDRKSHWSARRARARARSSTCCCASTIPTAAPAIDGQDIRRRRWNRCARAIALVTQERMLFDDIAATTSAGQAAASRAELEAAAKAAHAATFIARCRKAMTRRSAKAA